MFRGFTFGLFTENHNTPATSSTVAAEAASRLSSQPPPSSQVSNSSVSPGGRSGKQTVRGQSKVTLKPDFRDPSPGNMDEDIVVEGPEREEVDVKEESEVLPDGTLHSTQRVSHHKIKHVTRTHTDPGGKEDVVEEDVEVPGTSKEDVYELFEHPPKLVQESEDIEQVLDDGRKVKKHVVMNRMVHLVKMHHESFDEEHHKTEEDYEIEEVIPGTESAFVTGLDSDSDEDEPSLPKGQTPSGAGASGTDPAPNVYDDKDTSYPKLVSYQYGSDVDGGGYLRSKPGESTLDVVDDMLATGRLTLDDFEGDDNIDGGLHGDEDESYTHRVVMKKEVHQKTTIKADGQEETVITEDSQVHQDSEPPEDLRQSMEEIIQHFMHDSPQMPRVHGVDDDHHDDAAHGDEGTEV